MRWASRPGPQIFSGHMCVLQKGSLRAAARARPGKVSLGREGTHPSLLCRQACDRVTEAGEGEEKGGEEGMGGRRKSGRGGKGRERQGEQEPEKGR